MESEERRGSGFAAGLVLGAILGAGVAVLLTSKMNEEMRERLRERGTEMGQRARERAEEMASRARGRAGGGRGAAGRRRPGAAGATTSWAARKLHPSTTERIRVSAAEGGLTDLDGALRIIRRLREAGHQAYLVGGSVRDLLMGRPPHDVDIVTDARPEQIALLFPRTVPVGVRFGVVLVPTESGVYDVATFRREGPYLDGRRPSFVEYATLEEDVRRRGC